MIGRTPKTDCELKGQKRKNEFKRLIESKRKVEANLKEIDDKIDRAAERDFKPKMYYEPLDDFLTAEEIVEFSCFFGKTTQEISTDLTSLC